MQRVVDTPNAAFLITRPAETVQRLLTLIEEAKKTLFLVSPYFSMEKQRNVLRSIEAALRRGVTVTLVMRKPDKATSASTMAVETLESLVKAGLRLYCVPDLHAKFYVSDNQALVTSLNLRDSSLANSIEIGVWMPAGSPGLAQVREIYKQDIEPHSTPTKPEGLRRTASARIKRPIQAEEPGHCIRCGDSIPFNPERPYCQHDYEEWSEYANPDYRDKVCHGCGDVWAATMNKPLCVECFGLVE